MSLLLPGLVNVELVGFSFICILYIFGRGHVTLEAPPDAHRPPLIALLGGVLRVNESRDVAVAWLRFLS